MWPRHRSSWPLPKDFLWTAILIVLSKAFDVTIANRAIMNERYKEYAFQKEQQKNIIISLLTVCRVPCYVHATRRVLNAGRFAATQIDAFFETVLLDEEHLEHCEKKKKRFWSESRRASVRAWRDRFLPFLPATTTCVCSLFSANEYAGPSCRMNPLLLLLLVVIVYLKKSASKQCARIRYEGRGYNITIKN